jgi:hypothetical protein
MDHRAVLDGPQSRSGRCGKEKESCSPGEQTPVFHPYITDCTEKLFLNFVTAMRVCNWRTRIRTRNITKPEIKI